MNCFTGCKQVSALSHRSWVASVAEREADNATGRHASEDFA
jgi:hypothetical protein